MKNTNFLFLFLLPTLLFAACQSTPTPPPAPPAAPETPAVPEVPTESKKQSPSAYGIDISKYQGDELSFLDQQKDSLTFIICKATEGITYTDSKFKSNWQNIIGKGFIRGTYHFYRSNDDPKKQVTNYVAAIEDLQSTDFPPIVDFEEGGIDKSQSVETIQNGLQVFLKALETQTNRKPIIYTDVNTGNKYLNNPAFANYALWIANYTKQAQPELPLVWKNKQWKIWQKTSSYVIDSQKNDFDIFNGTRAELLKFIKNY